MADITERLLKMYSHRGDGLPTQYVNPDGPDAVATIQSLQAERERCEEDRDLWKQSEETCRRQHDKLSDENALLKKSFTDARIDAGEAMKAACLAALVDPNRICMASNAIQALDTAAIVGDGA